MIIKDNWTFIEHWTFIGESPFSCLGILVRLCRYHIMNVNDQVQTSIIVYELWTMRSTRFMWRNNW